MPKKLGLVSIGSIGGLTSTDKTTPPNPSDGVLLLEDDVSKFLLEVADFLILE